MRYVRGKLGQAVEAVRVDKAAAMQQEQEVGHGGMNGPMAQDSNGDQPLPSPKHDGDEHVRKEEEREMGTGSSELVSSARPAKPVVSGGMSAGMSAGLSVGGGDACDGEEWSNEGDKDHENMETEEEDEEEDERLESFEGNPGGSLERVGLHSATASDGFTARTRYLLYQLQKLLPMGSSVDGGKHATEVSVSDQVLPVLQDPSRKQPSRISCARMFVDLLVLQNRSYITLSQPSPYKDMKITAKPKLYEDLQATGGATPSGHTTINHKLSQMLSNGKAAATPTNGQAVMINIVTEPNSSTQQRKRAHKA